MGRTLHSLASTSLTSLRPLWKEKRTMQLGGVPSSCVTTSSTVPSYQTGHEDGGCGGQTRGRGRQSGFVVWGWQPRQTGHLASPSSPSECHSCQGRLRSGLHSLISHLHRSAWPRRVPRRLGSGSWCPMPLGNPSGRAPFGSSARRARKCRSRLSVEQRGCPPRGMSTFIKGYTFTVSK